MKRPFVPFMMLVLLLSSCQLPGGLGDSSPGSPDEPGSLTSVAPATEASVIHLTIPGELPTERAGQAGDYDSSKTAAQFRAPGGDRHTFERYERPFNAETMDVYFPEIDILDTLVYQDDTWVYGVITLRGLDKNNALSGTYGIEFDTTRDGRGDTLVLVRGVSSTDWTTDGVGVYFDSNDDVGGALAMYTDEQPIYSDGYESTLFDNGIGDDPDLAWVRISPQDKLTVQIAIKKSALKLTDVGYMVGMWAGHDDLNPANFDINDRFSHDQSGAADKGLEFFYPVKEVSELDNSCRMAVGFQPTGGEPGLCQLGGAAPVDEGACREPAGGCCGGSVCGLIWNQSSCSCQLLLFP